MRAKSIPSTARRQRYARGVDYVLPAEGEIKTVLDRIRGHFTANTPYRIIDTATGQPITDLSKPTRTAGIDGRWCGVGSSSR